MKLLFLSMHYKPEPCDTRTSVLAQEMAKRGNECTVLTSFPNYPFGHVYEGYKQRLMQRSVVDGVEVVRVPMFPDHSRSIKRRALSYASFGASAGLIGPLATKRPDLVWIHHPPLTTGFAGWWLARLKRVPFVYEIHDLWPETLLSSGMVGEGRATRAIRSMCDFLHQRAAAVVVTSEGMKSHLVRQGLGEEKVQVVHQWADEKALAPVERNAEFGHANGLGGKFNIVFTGNVGAAQGIDTILGAALQLRHFHRIQFVIVGAGLELDQLREKTAAMRLENVKFVGQVPKESVPDYLAWADGLLVMLKDDPLFTITIPSKTQAYMLAGRPLLCGVAGDTADIVDRTGSGLSFTPEDKYALADAVLDLFAMTEDERIQHGKSARLAYDAEFSVGRSVERYESLFARVLDPQHCESRTEMQRAA